MGELVPGSLMKFLTSGGLAPTSPVALSPSITVKFKVSSEDDRVTELSGRCSAGPGSTIARLRLRGVGLGEVE